MSFAMQLLSGISLMIVFGCVEKVQSVSYSDRLVWNTSFIAFVEKLQERVGSTDCSQQALKDYKNLEYADLQTLQDCKEATKQLLKVTVASFTVDALHRNKEFIESSIKGLCRGLNTVLPIEMRYANLPLRDELWYLYAKIQGQV